MPRHESAAKRVITSEKRRRRNSAMKSRVRAAVKAVREARTAESARAALREAVSVLDRASAKGILKRQTADRHKSRLAIHVQKVPTSA